MGWPIVIGPAAVRRALERRPNRRLGRAVDVPDLPCARISNPSASTGATASPPHNTREIATAGPGPASTSIAHVAGVACITVASDSSNLLRRAITVTPVPTPAPISTCPPATSGQEQLQ